MVGLTVAAAALMPANGLAATPIATDWVQGPAQGPPARAAAAEAYDSTRGRTVLFGGTTSASSAASSTFDGDTWENDGATWTQIPVSGPPARAFGQMVYDSARAVSVLFGGYSGSGVLGDTWEWDGLTWTQRVTLHSPPARFWFAMTYDSTRHVTVLFGGSGPTGTLLGDTWEYNGNDWTQVTTAHAPSARMGLGLAFDAVRGRTVLFGGRTDSRLNDTWEYDGIDWTQVAASNPPTARFWHSMAYDAALGTVVVFGGDYFVPFCCLGSNNETWVYDGSCWQQLLTTDRPSPRIWAPVAYDTAHSTLVMFGGDNEVAPDAVFGDTQELTPIGNAPVAGLAIAFLHFPQEPALSTTSQPVTLTNAGAAPLAISGIAGSGAFATSDDCPRSPATLAAGAACTITVAFTPPNGNFGSMTGTLTLTDNAGTGAQSIPLSGSGEWGFLQASPSPVDFGAVVINQAAPATVIETITVPAQATLVTGFDATSPFVATNLDCPLGTALSFGATCHVQIAFAPSTGGTYTGQLTIHDNEQGFARTVQLSGTAIVVPPATITLQLSYGGGATAPTFAHTLNVQAQTNIASGTATFSFNGQQVGGSVNLVGGSGVQTISLDDSLIPAGAGTYPLVVSVHSTDPNVSDNSVTQSVMVRQAAENLAWTGTGLAVAGVPAVLSAKVAPPAGETQLYDFRDHPVWVRFDVSDSSGSESTYYAQVSDVMTPFGYLGQGTASVDGAALVPGAYRVRARLVASSGSDGPNAYAGGEDLVTAYAAEPARGGFMAGAGQQQSMSLAFEFAPGSTPSGGLQWVQAVQVTGSDGGLHDAYKVIASTLVGSVDSHSHTATATGQASVAVFDATTGARYAAFDQNTTYQLSVAADGTVNLTTGAGSWSGTLSPGPAINHL